MKAALSLVYLLAPLALCDGDGSIYIDAACGRKLNLVPTFDDRLVPSRTIIPSPPEHITDGADRPSIPSSEQEEATIREAIKIVYQRAHGTIMFLEGQLEPDPRMDVIRSHLLDARQEKEDEVKRMLTVQQYLNRPFPSRVRLQHNELMTLTIF